MPAANKLLRRAKSLAVRPLVLQSFRDPCVLTWSDARWASCRDRSSQGGYLVALADASALDGVCPPSALSVGILVSCIVRHAQAVTARHRQHHWPGTAASLLQTCCIMGATSGTGRTAAARFRRLSLSTVEAPTALWHARRAPVWVYRTLSSGVCPEGLDFLI